MNNISFFDKKNNQNIIHKRLIDYYDDNNKLKIINMNEKIDHIIFDDDIIKNDINNKEIRMMIIIKNIQNDIYQLS